MIQQHEDEIRLNGITDSGIPFWTYSVFARWRVISSPSISVKSRAPASHIS